MNENMKWTTQTLDAVVASPSTKLKMGDELPVDHDHHHEDGELEDGGSPKKKKRDNSSSLRKAPQAPKRFKSSYICFFMAKQPEIKEALGDKATVTEISKRSAEMWRTLPADERVHWDEVAAKDKQRYLVEKASYTGPWQVPWKRAKKDPSAPKRPMSAFLYFSQGRRSKIKEENPEMKNTEVSRMLGEMWRNASKEQRKPYVDKEREEREKYKIAISEWRVDYENKKEEERKQRAAQQAQQAQWAQQHHQFPAPDGTDPNAPPHHYQQPYGVPPPPGPPYGYPPAPPHFYGVYAPPPGIFQYPINGKQPIILGPNGMPHYPPPPPPPTPASNTNPAQAPYTSQPSNFDDAPTPAEGYEYLTDQIAEPQTAE